MMARLVARFVFFFNKIDSLKLKILQKESHNCILCIVVGSKKVPV